LVISVKAIARGRAFWAQACDAKTITAKTAMHVGFI